MALPFTLGAVSELFVEGYDGFDRPQKAALVDLISDGTSTNDQVLQQGSLPFRQATLTGFSYDADDVALLRTYNDTKEIVTFVDGDGVSIDVRVLDFGAKSYTGRWTWSLVLIDAG